VKGGLDDNLKECSGFLRLGRALDDSGGNGLRAETGQEFAV
jgi:hypothetical protein